jgi:hypothetical protein
MSEIIAVVPESGKTEMVGGNFGFILDAGLKGPVLSLPHGILRRHPDNDQQVHVGRRLPKWRISLAQSDKLIFQEDVDELELEALLIRAPDCVVAVPAEDIDQLTIRCMAAGRSIQTLNLFQRLHGQPIAA